MQADPDEATLRQIWERTLATSPVRKILTPRATIKRGRRSVPNLR